MDWLYHRRINFDLYPHIGSIDIFPGGGDFKNSLIYLSDLQESGLY